MDNYCCRKCQFEWLQLLAKFTAQSIEAALTYFGTSTNNLVYPVFLVFMCVCGWLLKQLNISRRNAAILNAHKAGAHGIHAVNYR